MPEAAVPSTKLNGPPTCVLPCHNVMLVKDALTLVVVPTWFLIVISVIFNGSMLAVSVKRIDKIELPVEPITI